MEKVQVGIIMGSDSDLAAMKKASAVFEEFGVKYFMTVASAHRTPERVMEIAARAEKEGWTAIIAAAGMAAHLAGFLAASSTIPIIGTPMDSSSLNGIDALLSTVQMPGGVPVACMGLGSAGAKNAALFVIEILALHDESMKKKLIDYRTAQKEDVMKKAANVERGVPGG